MDRCAGRSRPVKNYSAPVRAACAAVVCTVGGQKRTLELVSVHQSSMHDREHTTLCEITQRAATLKLVFNVMLTDCLNTI